MYIPISNREDDPEVLGGLMRRYSFATLVTVTDEGPFASHLPFLLDAGRGPHGTLRAHLARANPQWRHFQEGREALVIFQGPHAYISPTWYETQPSVPTWNYAVVHASGVPRLLGDDALYDLLRESIAHYEPEGERSPALDLPEDYVRTMMRAVVGFEIEIARLEGKLKMSQNRPAVDRERVTAALEETGDPQAAEVAAWMGSLGREKP